MTVSSAILDTKLSSIHQVDFQILTRVDEESWAILDVQGVAPKQREGSKCFYNRILDFACAYFNEALYFFGGFQKYLGDQTGSSVYRLDLLLKEWQTVIQTAQELGYSSRRLSCF